MKKTTFKKGLVFALIIWCGISMCLWTILIIIHVTVLIAAMILGLPLQSFYLCGVDYFYSAITIPLLIYTVIGVFSKWHGADLREFLNKDVTTPNKCNDIMSEE